MFNSHGIFERISFPCQSREPQSVCKCLLTSPLRFSRGPRPKFVGLQSHGRRSEVSACLVLLLFNGGAERELVIVVALPTALFYFASSPQLKHKRSRDFVQIVRSAVDMLVGPMSASASFVTSWCPMLSTSDSHMTQVEGDNGPSLPLERWRHASSRPQPDGDPTTTKPL